MKARTLFETFGMEIFEQIKQGDPKTFESILSYESSVALIEGFKKHENLKYAPYFVKKGIPPKVQQLLFEFYDHKCIELIEDNPYILTIFGLSYAKTDQIALKYFGVREDDRRRLNASVEQAMNQYCRQGGHTYCNVKDLKSRLTKILNNDVLTQKAIQHAHNSNTIRVEDENIFHGSLKFMEHYIALFIENLTRLKVWESRFHDSFEYAINQVQFQLTAQQLQAIMNTLEYAISTITGGAGTGKTTVLKSVVEAVTHAGFKVYGLALSGRAAKRLRESIDIETYTIQRFLMLDNLENLHQEPTVILIDEASMLDIQHMYKIINKLAPNNRIVLVGDEAQLAPIGTGLILSEVVRCGIVPTTHLDVVKRQDKTTGIPHYADLIRNKQVPTPLSQGNIQFNLCSNRYLVDQIVDHYMSLTGEVQILTPTRKLTQLINETCQKRKNPNGQNVFIQGVHGLEDTGLKLHDPIIFTKNDYRLDVQNGTLGQVIEVRKADSDVIAVVETDVGHKVNVTRSLVDNIELAYAITLHKAQGSQFKQVIIPIVKSKVMDNAWVYTSITRAVEKISFFGEPSLMKKAILSDTQVGKRKVCLSALINIENEKNKNNNVEFEYETN